MIQQTARELNMTTKQLGASIDSSSITKPLQESADAYTVVTKKQGVYRGSSAQVVTSQKMLGDQVLDTSKKITVGSQKSIFSMLKFKDFVGKIVHYVTFSIGVQMVMGIQRGFQAVIENFKEFERAAANAATVSGYLGGSFEQVKNRMMEMSKVLSRETVYSALEIQKSFYQLASAGLDVAKITRQQMLPILNYAAATQSDLENATEDVLTTMKAFGLELDDTTRIVDTFTSAITNSFFNMEKMSEFMKYAAPIAGALGLQLEETVAAGMLLVNMGLKGSQAGQRLNMILSKLLEPSSKAEEMLASIGLTTEDLNPELYSLTEILNKLNAAGFGAAEAASMFRARTAASAAVLVQGVYDIERYNQELLLSKGITESVADAQENTLWGALQSLSNAFQEVSLELGSTLAPILEGFAQSMIVIAPKIAKFVKQFIKFLPVLIKIVKWFLVYKVVMILITNITKALVALETIFLIIKGKQVILENSWIAALYGSIHALLARIPALAANAALLKAMAVAMSIATVGIAVAVGMAALAASGFFTLTDAAIDLTTSVKDLGTTLQSVSGDAFRGMIQTIDAWKLAVWEADHSNRGFVASLNEINKAADRMDVDLAGATSWGELINEAIKKQTGDKLENTYEEMGKRAALALAASQKKVLTKKQFEVYSKEITKVLKTNLVGETNKAFKAMGTNWQKAADNLNPDAFGWELLAGGAGIAGREINNLFDAFDALNSIYQYKEARAYFSQMLDVPIKDIVDQTSLLNEVTKILIGKTLEEVEAMATWEMLVNKASTELAFYNSNLDDLKATYDELAIVTAELDDAKENESNNIEKILDLEKKELILTNKLADSKTNLMSAIKGIITEIRTMGELMDTAVGYIEELAEAERDWKDTKENLTRSIQDEEAATLDLAEALALHGAGSNEAMNAERALQDAIQDRIDLEQQAGEQERALKNAEAQIEYTKNHGVVAEKTKDELKSLGYTIKEINKMLQDMNYNQEQVWAFEGKKKKEKEWWDPSKLWSEDYTWEDTEQEALTVTMPLTLGELELMKVTEDLAEARETLADADAKQAALEAKLLAFSALQENYTKYTTERMKNYLEVLIKIYDIKEKLYKLEEGELEQFEKLFEKLAEEGMLSEETIELYKQMEQAKGDQLKLNKPLSDVYGDLSDKERELVGQYINEEITLGELNKALAEYYRTSDDTTQITESQMNVITEYRDATIKLNDAISGLEEQLGPLVYDLMDIGAVAPDAAKAWLDIADNEAEASKQNVDMILQLSKISDEMDSMVGSTTRLAMSFMDLEGEEIVDTFDEIAAALELTGSIMGSDAEQLKVLNAFYGTSNKSLSEFTDGQLVAALTMIDLAQAAGMWQDGMDGASLATELGQGSLDAVVNSATVAINAEESFYEVQTQLTEAIVAFTDATGELTRIFNLFVQSATGMHPLAISMQTDFHNLIEEYGDLGSVIEELGQYDIKLPDFTFDVWDTEDWQTWADQLNDTPGLVSEISQAVPGIPVDVETLWDGTSWSTFYKVLTGEQQNSFRAAMDRYTAIAELSTLWEGQDFDGFLSTLGSRKDAFLQKVSEMSDTPIEVIETWDNVDWATFLSNNQSNLSLLKDYFDTNHATIFIDYALTDPNFPEKAIAAASGTAAGGKTGGGGGGFDLFGAIGGAFNFVKDSIGGIAGKVMDIAGGAFDTFKKVGGNVLKNIPIIGGLFGGGGGKTSTATVSTMPAADKSLEALGSKVDYAGDVIIDAGDELNRDGAQVGNQWIRDSGLASSTTINAANTAGNNTITSSSIFKSGVISTGNTFMDRILNAASGFVSKVNSAATTTKAAAETAAKKTSTTTPKTSSTQSKTSTPTTPTPTTPSRAPSIVDTAVKAVTDPIGTVVKAITDPIGTIGSVIDGAANLIGGAVDAVGSFLGGFKFWQTGGFVKGATPSIIGEAGMEAIIPLEGVNKKYAADILQKILSRYPELISQMDFLSKKNEMTKALTDIDTRKIFKKLIPPRTKGRAPGVGMLPFPSIGAPGFRIPEGVGGYGTSPSQMIPLRERLTANYGNNTTINQGESSREEFNIMGALNINGVQSPVDFERKLMEILKKKRRTTM